MRWGLSLLWIADLGLSSQGVGAWHCHAPTLHCHVPINHDNAVHMIGHHHKSITTHMRKMLRNRLPAVIHRFTKSIHLHLAINNIPK